MIQLPKKMEPVFKPARGTKRYRFAYGGRGSAKSYSFALMAAVWGACEPLRILATREFQDSIKESFYAELERVITDTPEIAGIYNIGESYIRAANGTEFIFKGLRRNITAIRSMAKIDLAIVEEAEDVPEKSWRDLIPTIREDKSEIWAIWNPRTRNSPVDKRFRERPPASAIGANLNYWDNPFFPEVLERDRQHDLATLDPATYAHIWEGDYLENSDTQVLHGKVQITEFEPGPDWDGPYYGLDFGFAADPTAAVECWIHQDTLYIRREAGRVGLEIDDTAKEVKQALPGVEKYVMYADSARPESISYLRRNGLPRLRPCGKWAGSVQDGVELLRGYQAIIVHPACRKTIKESRLYSYKTDRLTGDILPQIIDANNHYIDAIRYALGPIIRRTTGRAKVGVA